MRKINEIIVHCTATPRGREVSVQEIDRWHRKRGFDAGTVSASGLRSIGYHYVIHLDGTVEPGRDEALIGAHCRGHNSHSIGICYVGGLSSDGRKPIDTRTDAQRMAMTRLIRELTERYPGATVHGHNEFAPKDCPCFNAGKEFGGNP